MILVSNASFLKPEHSDNGASSTGRNLAFVAFVEEVFSVVLEENGPVSRIINTIRFFRPGLTLRIIQRTQRRVPGKCSRIDFLGS